jgi:hypothetical protein
VGSGRAPHRPREAGARRLTAAPMRRPAAAAPARSTPACAERGRPQEIKTNRANTIRTRYSCIMGTAAEFYYIHIREHV